MILTRTPFRISLFGGGTDMPAWFNLNGGAVISFSIDKYCHLSIRELPPYFDYKYRAVYSKVETAVTSAVANSSFSAITSIPSFVT